MNKKLKEIFLVGLISNMLCAFILTSCEQEPNYADQFMVNQKHSHINGRETILTQLYVCDDYKIDRYYHSYELVYTNKVTTVLDSVMYHLDNEMKKLETYKEILSK